MRSPEMLKKITGSYLRHRKNLGDKGEGGKEMICGSGVGLGLGGSGRMVEKKVGFAEQMK